jgi:probable rRNA maturation factor
VFQIDICNRQSSLPIDPVWLRQVVATVLRGEAVQHAEISLAVVSDAEIQELNLRFLERDEATDVLSFPLDVRDDLLDGEVVVSADRAQARCREFGWSASDELTLYVVHGTLHLAGYLDETAEDRSRMQARESDYLKQLGLTRQSPDTNQPPRPSQVSFGRGESDA